MDRGSERLMWSRDPSVAFSSIRMTYARGLVGCARESPSARVIGRGAWGRGYLVSALEEGEDALGGAVGGGEDGGAGLDEDLGAGELGGFLGEVGVADGALAGGDVFQSDAEGVHVGLEGVLLEGAQASA